MAKIEIEFAQAQTEGGGVTVAPILISQFKVGSHVAQLYFCASGSTKLGIDSKALEDGSVVPIENGNNVLLQEAQLTPDWIIAPDNAIDPKDTVTREMENVGIEEARFLFGLGVTRSSIAKIYCAMERARIRGGNV